MLTLFQTKVLKGRHLPDLVEVANSGDIIAGLGKIHGLDTWPHDLGVMQREGDDETDHCYYIGGEVIFRGQCTQCLPFYDGVIIRRGHDFFLSDDLYYSHKGTIGSCIPHPSGGVVVEDGRKFTLIGKKSRLGRKVRVLNSQSQGFEEKEYTPGGVMTRLSNKFFFNGELVFEWPDEWKSQHWRPFDRQVLVRVESKGYSTFFLNYNEQFQIKYCSDIVLLPHLGTGFIITRDGFYFTANGKALEREVPCDRVSFHPHGVLIERKGEFSLLVIK
jgi:hypothetical protein